MNLSVQLLGPVEVAHDGTTVSLGGPKPRALLAMLALQAGATVSTDRLLDGLWGEEPPPSASKLVQVYVSHLRKALTTTGAEGVIVTRGHGYQLHVDRSQVDVTRFERLLAQGAAREALQLWRGSPLSDVAYEPFAGPEIRRLTELRSAALEVAIDQDLEAGRHREVLPELETLLGEEPFRERLHAQRIVALYRCGRQADALEAYREARSTLVNEVGVEPGLELRQLHDAILRQDPALDAPALDATTAETDGSPLHVSHASDPAAARTRMNEVTERLGELATRTSRERADWRIVGDELAAGVVELQDLRQRAAADEAGASGVAGSPFKGLESFDVDDAKIFFGRERLVAEMVARLPGARLVGVAGASGSGKSSLLRAGLLPALAAGVLPGSAGWASAVLRPGRHPHRALAQAAAKLGSEAPAVLLVDQFEEVFTTCSDESERTRFIEGVVALARDHRRRTLAIIAIRADFYGYCAGYPQLAHMLEGNTMLVGAMRGDELRRAIEQPARAANVEVEPALVDALVADVEGQPGALPLLSTALLELWQNTAEEQHDDRSLRLAEYRESGGVHGAVARLAEAAYNRLDDEQQRRAKRLLLRLAGDGDVRLRVPRSELGTADDVVSVLAADRLITVDEEHVEVAHEALLREWPRLVEWLEEDAEGRRLHRHLTSTARDWNASGRQAEDLYRGSRVAAASEWAAAHTDDLIDVERDFVAASVRADQAQAESQRATNRRLRTLLSGVAGLLVLALVAGALALTQRREAQDVAVVADARRLGAQALNREQLDDALLLASTGVELHPSVDTYSNLLSVLLRQPAQLGEVRADGWPLYAGAVSDDGSMLAVGDERGGVTVYDTKTRTRLSQHFVSEDIAQDLVFSPDGRTLAASSYAVIDLIDPRTGEQQQRFEMPAPPSPLGFALVTVVFHPNGRDLVVHQTDAGADGGGASILTRLDGDTGQPLRGPVEVGTSSSWSMPATADRRELFVTSPLEDVTYQIDPDTLRVGRTYDAGGVSAAVTDDGGLLAVGSEAGRVELIERASGRVIPMRGRHQDGSDIGLEFTPDGDTLITTAGEGEILMWDVADRRPEQRLVGHSRGIYGPFTSPDGRTLYTASTDARLAMWDVVGDRRLDRRFEAGPPLVLENQSPKGLASSPDGELVAVTQPEGRVDLLDAESLDLRSSLSAPQTALAVAFSRDGRMLAAAGEQGDVTVWDIPSGRTLRTIEGSSGTSQSLVFTQDGQHLIVAEYASENGRFPGRVWLYDVATGKPEAFEFPLSSPSISLSPDGTLVAGVGLFEPSEVRNLETGEVIARLETSDDARTVAFSPDGKLLAVGHYGGSVVLLSTDDYEQVGRSMAAHQSRVTALEFSPDGRRLLTGSPDGTVKLWDVASQQPIGSALTVEYDAYVAATFTPDGDHVLAVPDRGDGIRLDVRESSWRRHACAVAGRQFSVEEWRHELPGLPYREVCAPASQ